MVAANLKSDRNWKDDPWRCEEVICRTSWKIKTQIEQQRKEYD